MGEQIRLDRERDQAVAELVRRLRDQAMSHYTLLNGVTKSTTVANAAYTMALLLGSGIPLWFWLPFWSAAFASLIMNFMKPAVATARSQRREEQKLDHRLAERINAVAPIGVEAHETAFATMVKVIRNSEVLRIVMIRDLRSQIGPDWSATP